MGGPLWHRRESDPLPDRWIRRSTVLGVCMVQASSLAGTDSLWDFGLGMGKKMALERPLFPAKLNSVVRGSTTLPPVVLQPSHSPSRAVSL